MRTASAAPDRAKRGLEQLAVYSTIAATSIAPSATQQIALPRSSATQNPAAALKQRTALVHPLAHAPGLLTIFKNFMTISKPLDTFIYLSTGQERLCWPEPMNGGSFVAESNLHQRSSILHEPRQFLD